MNNYEEMLKTLGQEEILKIVNSYLHHAESQRKYHQIYNAKKNFALRELRARAREKGVSLDALIASL